MSKFKNILLIAGGTGGHVFPAYSLAKYLKTEKKRVNIITDDRGYKYLKEYNFNECGCVQRHLHETNSQQKARNRFNNK